MTDTPANSPAPAAPMTPAKKRSIGRLIFRLFLVFVLLMVIGLVVLFFSANNLVRRGVVYGGQYATGQETALDEANLSFVGGALTLNSLGIKNLKDYKESSLLKMKQCSTTLESGSLFTDTIVVKEIAIDGLEVTVEQNGIRNNLNELMAILQKNSPSAGSSAPSSAKGRQLKIQKLTLAGTQIHIRGLLTRDFKLDTIVFDEPTNPDGRPMKIADLTAKILMKVCQQMLDDPQMPGDIKKQMGNVTALVGNLKGELNKNVKVFSASLSELSKDPLKGAQDLGKNAQDLGKNLQNLQNLNPLAPKATQTQPK